MKNIFVMFVLTFAFTGYAFGECTDADKKALESFDRAWGDAGEKGDRAALMNVYADDFVGIGLTDMAGKTAAIDGAVKTAERNRANPQMADKVTHDYYLISCTPTTATITHRNTISTMNGAGGKPETFYTRSAHFLEKRGGKWQVVSNAGSPIDDNATLLYMEREWNDAYLKRDMNWFEKNYAADFSNVGSHTAALMNKAEDMADTKNDKSVTESTELSEMNVRMDGNTAIVTGVNHVKGRDEKGQPMDFRLRFTDTFIKRGGRWQVWATQGTRIP